MAEPTDDDVTESKRLDLKDAMEITDPAEADAWLNHYVVWIMDERPCGIKEAQDIARQNLGYFSGYYGIEIQRRVEKLFRTEHPIFGPVGGAGLTPQQAMDTGKNMAAGMSIEDALEAARRETTVRCPDCGHEWETTDGE